MLHFPFWLATPAADQSTEAVEGCAAATTPLTFSSAEKMGAFLAGSQSGHWETKLVDRYSTPAVLQKLADEGHSELCHDVNQHGIGGKTISLAEILATLNTKH